MSKNACDQIAQMTKLIKEEGNEEEVAKTYTVEVWKKKKIKVIHYLTDYWNGALLLSVLTTDVRVVDSSQDVHSLAIRNLAELTARSIEQFHKVAETILFCTSQELTTLEQAKILSQ